jgi:integrase
MKHKNQLPLPAGPAPKRIVIGEHVTLVARGKRQTWTADYAFINDKGQRQHGRKSFGTRNRQIAEKKARALEVKLSEGTFTPELNRSTAIDSAITDFIASKKAEGAALKTTAKYEAELKTYSLFLKQQGISLLQQIDVRLDDQYKQRRQERDGLGTYTLYAHAMIRKSFLSWCVSRKHLASSPLAGVKVPKPRRQKYPAATLEQVNQILASATGSLVAVLAVLAFTGLRIGEVAALRPQDVDLLEGMLHVRRREGWGPKTEASERSIPIHRRLLALLRALPKPRGDFFFNAPRSARFPRGENHLNPRDVNEQFQKLAKQHGMLVGRKNVGLTVHALRRTFKTCCFDAGVPKPLLDRWVGHEDQSNMDTFYYDPQKSKEWMQKVPFGEPNEQDLMSLNSGVGHDKAD